MVVEVWLYGELARYGKGTVEASFATMTVALTHGNTLADLMEKIGLPTSERGITFINGQLSAMPGLQPDLGHVLCDHDRIGFFDLKSMWPFQYRHGAALTDEWKLAMERGDSSGLHTTYDMKK
jgi:hypothetical protein